MSIQYLDDKRMFLLQMRESTYAFCVDNDGHLCHIYWGEQVIEPDDFPTLDELSQRTSIPSIRGGSQEDIQEYRGYGGYTQIEPSLKVTFSDGTGDLYVGLPILLRGDMQSKLIRIQAQNQA